MKEQSVERNRSRLSEFFSEPLIFCEYLSREWARGRPVRLRKSFSQTSGEDLAGAICHWNPAAIRDVRSKSQWHLRSGLSSYPNGVLPLHRGWARRAPSAFFLVFSLAHFTPVISLLVLPSARALVIRSMGNFSWTVSGGERYPVKIRKANSGRQIRVSFGSSQG